MSAIFVYPNAQPSTTAWYHDHALGITRLNVVAGLSGFYIIRDPNEPSLPLPTGVYDVGLNIQDRLFNETTGQLRFRSDGDNVAKHPFWRKMFSGDVICVNSRAWPNFNVDRGQYLFRVLNGANARFFDLFLQVELEDGGEGELVPFTVVGNDGGYLQSAVVVSSLLLAPSDRFMVIIDFGAFVAGTKIILKNSAAAPSFPSGPPPDANTALVMRFTVQSAIGFVPQQALPEILNADLATYPSLSEPSRTRVFTMLEVSDPETALIEELLLDGVPWMMPVSEIVELGSTEEWTIINFSGEVHPIHLHLVQFQLIGYRPLNNSKYRIDWLAQQSSPPPLERARPLDPELYWIGELEPAGPIDRGWQDTVHGKVGVATIFRVRFAPIDGAQDFLGNVTDPSHPGFVWHCHILDHEDNDMMRPYLVRKNVIITTESSFASTTLTETTSAPSTTPSTSTPPCTNHVVITATQSFIPNTISVNYGDSVTFDWAGTSAYHNVQSANSLFDCSLDNGDRFTSGNVVAGPFSYVLNVTEENGFSSDQPGQSYFYNCQVHCLTGMAGSLTVQGACQLPCAEDPDLNGDSRVDLLDILPVLDRWGQCGNCAEDINCDGSVDLNDVLAVINAWT